MLVLEKEEHWIAGSSARANGGFRQQFSTPVNIQLSQLSLNVFESFKEEFNTDIAFRQYGYLFLTASDRGESALKTNAAVQQAHGVPVKWLSSREIIEKVPFVETKDLRGGTFCGVDGYADSYSIAEGFGRRARELGAEIAAGKPVTGILHASSRVEGVRTSRREIRADRVVNAAGPYAASIGEMAGLRVPVQPVRRMLVMTEDFPHIPDTIPMTIDADTGFLMRKESGKVLMGWSDPDEPPGFNLGFDASFVEILARKAVKRVPLLEKARINPRRSWAGLYEVTPDHHCILGEAQQLPGFFLTVGFSGHGMMHSPAAGMLLADLILEGRTELIDPYPLRLSRFEEDDLIEETVVL